MRIYVDESRHENLQYLGRTLEFVDDMPDGGCLCNCGYCGETTKVYLTSETCESCGNDLVYNTKYSW